jgi:SagB-type dehydrogenase family enzyme
MAFRIVGVMSILAILLLPAGILVSQTQASEVIQLPDPQTSGGKPLMQALQERKTTRSFSPRELPQGMLSNLLWAAFGVNRPEVGKRTAPSARNRQEIDIYVATADGLYLYDGKAHGLKLILAQDLRAATGKQDFVAVAPVNLVYVADYAKMGGTKEQDKLRYSGADTGFIAQNVYLYCASEGLATVVRGWIDRPALAEAMKLRPDQRIVLSHTVGYPGE